LNQRKESKKRRKGKEKGREEKRRKRKEGVAVQMLSMSNVKRAVHGTALKRRGLAKPSSNQQSGQYLGAAPIRRGLT
jgi:hypothetical protein